jgi:hypothetical protein
VLLVWDRVSDPVVERSSTLLQLMLLRLR